MHRRQLFKLGLSAALVSLVSPFVFSQPDGNVKNQTSGHSAAGNKLDDTVTYNAGWIVLIEDKAQLQELESKKTKEQEELKQKGAKLAGQNEAQKGGAKTFSDKYQEMINKVKSFF